MERIREQNGLAFDAAVLAQGASLTTVAATLVRTSSLGREPPPDATVCFGQWHARWRLIYSPPPKTDTGNCPSSRDNSQLMSGFRRKSPRSPVE